MDLLDRLPKKDDYSASGMGQLQTQPLEMSVF